MPKKEEDNFVRAVTDHGGLKAVKEKLSGIDCMKAKASNPHDQTKVRGLIQNPDEVNEAVKGRFIEWCGEAFKASLN